MTVVFAEIERMLPAVKTAPPVGPWRELEQAVKATEPGRRGVRLLVPERTSTGWQERKALALIAFDGMVWR